MNNSVRRFSSAILAAVSALTIAISTPKIMPDSKTASNIVTTVHAASSSLQTGVSKTACSRNLSAGPLPANISSATVGDTVYANAAVKSNEYVKSFTFQVKAPGASGFSTFASDTAKNYMRYAYEAYRFGSAGTYQFRVVTKFTNGSSITSNTTSVTVKAQASSSSSSVKYTDFTSDSRWKVGKTWGYSQTPLIGQKGFKGCAALCSDWVKYRYGKNVTAGSTYTSVNNIKAGDVLKMYHKGTTSQHWIIVVARNGNTLSVLEGNWDSKIVYTSGTYKISGGYLTRGSKSFQLVTGYHY